MTPLRDWGTRSGAALAAAAFLTLLASLLRVEPIPPIILAIIVALVPLSAVRPQAGLLVLAALTPFAAWIGRHWNGSVAWPETLAVAFCAGYCARRVVRAPRSRDAIDAPWLLAISVVVASLAVHFLIEAWRFGGPPTRADLWQLVTYGYFISDTSGNPIDAAMRLIESLLIFRAAATMTRAEPAFAVRLVSWVVCGASAAAGLNLLRLWESAERFEGSFAAFARLFLSERVNVHYGDLNAAGSYFVMVLFVAIGLSMRRKGLPWLVSVLLIGCRRLGDRLAHGGRRRHARHGPARRRAGLADAARRLAPHDARRRGPAPRPPGGGRRVRHPRTRQPAIGDHRGERPLGTGPNQRADDGIQPDVRRRHRSLLLAVGRVQLAGTPRELPAGHPRKRAQQLSADTRRARHRRLRLRFVAALEHRAIWTTAARRRPARPAAMEPGHRATGVRASPGWVVTRSSSTSRPSRSGSSSERSRVGGPRPNPRTAVCTCAPGSYPRRCC